MIDKISKLGRLDRAIAENLKDLRSCFEDDAGVVLDFIVFISARIKTDLFGYTRFTLKEFCETTGRHRQDLAMKHPLFREPGKRAPEIEGVRFESVFDYSLILMMRRNLIFSKVIQSREEEHLIQLESIRILQDVKIGVNRKSNQIKVYEVRLSEELLNGFIRRYYTIDICAYRKAGKGRGKEQRQALVIYLSVLRHILLSQSLYTTIVPIDFLAHQANVSVGKTLSHRNESVYSILQFIKEKTDFRFDYRVCPVRNGQHKSVELIFQPADDRSDLIREHNFYFLLLKYLREFFESSAGKGAFSLDTEKAEAFQFWLNSKKDQSEKAGILKHCYQQVFHEILPDSKAFSWINSNEHEV